MRLFKAVAAVGPLLATVPASAEDTIRWGEVRGWEIMVDQTLGYGCFMVSGFEDGTFFRLGLSPNESTSYMMLGNDLWSSIEDGKDYSIQARFESGTPFDGVATGSRMGNTPVLIIVGLDVDFIKFIARKHVIEFRYEGREVAKLSLAGTSAALLEVFRCQEAMDNNDSPPSAGDPFSKGRPTPASNDPFRRT